LKVQSAVMERRKISADNIYQKLLIDIFKITSEDRRRAKTKKGLINFQK